MIPMIIRLMSVPAEIFEASCSMDILMDEEVTVAKMVAVVPATALTLAFPSAVVKRTGRSTYTNPSNGIVCSHEKFNNIVLLAPASNVLIVIVEFIILPGTRITCGIKK